MECVGQWFLTYIYTFRINIQIYHSFIKNYIFFCDFIYLLGRNGGLT